MILPLTPVRFKQHAARIFGNKTGIVCGDLRITYREFNERCDRFSSALVELEVKAHDPIAFLSFNCHRLLEAYYAVPQIQAILVPLNIRLSAEELAQILQDCEPRLLFFDPEFTATVETLRACVPCLRHCICLREPRPEWAYPQTHEELLAQSKPQEFDFLSIDENLVAELFYTSGTTAHPKGVMLTHRSLYLHALYVASALRLGDDDTGIYTVPLFHVNSWGSPHTLTLTGARHVILRKFDPQALIELIHRERVTRLQMVPSMVIALINHPDFSKRDLSSIKEVMIGGAPSNTTLIRQVEEKFSGARVAGGYGLTETSPVVSVAYIKDHRKNDEPAIQQRRKATAGYSIAGVEARVVDADGHDVTPNGQETGEVIIRSDTVMEGYWNDSEVSARALRGGWLHTDDLGTIDEEGYILIVDRIKDMVLSGGENIATAEIERVIYQHPAVLECAVVAVPDEQWGEAAKALITLRPGETASEEEILSHCRRHLAGFKTPKTVEFRDSLPKGGTGKILKRVLRERYWQGHERRVH